MTSILTLLDDVHKLSLEETRERCAQAGTVARELQRLLAAPGWPFFAELLSANAKTIEQEILSQAQFGDLGDAFRDQYKKGLVRGLRRVESLAPEFIGHYVLIRDTLATMLEKEIPDGSSTDHDSGAESNGAFAP